MVKGDGMNQRYGKTPDANQVSAHLRVCATEALEFHSWNGSGIRPKNLTILAGHLCQENHLTDIVQQPSCKALFHYCLGTTLRTRNTLRQRCDCHTVIPERRQVSGDLGIPVTLGKDVDR